jgi:hypothetical protein
LTVGLSALNFVSFMFYKYSIENIAVEHAKLNYLLKKSNNDYKIPDYIVISEKPLFNENLIEIEKIQNDYVYIKYSYIEEKLKIFSKVLFLWDFVIVFSLIFVMYFTIIKYLKKEKLIKDYLEIILLTISHKLGNFLSVQKVNLEIIKEKCSINAVKRLEFAFNLIEKDFKLTLSLLKNIENFEIREEKVNVKKTIEEILKYFDLKNIKLTLKLKDTNLKINKNDFENILYILIENAVKYSKDKIYIKVCKNNKNLIIAIKNDIGYIKIGSGIGLELAKFLAKKNGWEFYTKSNKNFLTVLKIDL